MCLKLSLTPESCSRQRKFKNASIKKRSNDLKRATDLLQLVLLAEIAFSVTFYYYLERLAETTYQSQKRVNPQK